MIISGITVSRGNAMLILMLTLRHTWTTAKHFACYWKQTVELLPQCLLAPSKLGLTSGELSALMVSMQGLLTTWKLSTMNAGKQYIIVKFTRFLDTQTSSRLRQTIDSKDQLELNLLNFIAIKLTNTILLLLHLSQPYDKYSD